MPPPIRTASRREYAGSRPFVVRAPPPAWAAPRLARRVEARRKAKTELPLLLALGQYLIVLAADDATGASAAVAATT